MLDAAGFEKAVITASNDLDEHLIASLKEQGAKISVWGVGTRLVTAWDQPALGGVYKLSAMRHKGGAWEHRVKLSEQTAKVSTPGMLQVRRFEQHGEAAGDMIWDELDGAPGTLMIDPFDPTRRKSFASEGRDLLVPIFRGGELVYQTPSLEEASAHRERELGRFHAGIKRFANPHRYPVGLESRLFERRTKLIMQGRK